MTSRTVLTIGVATLIGLAAAPGVAQTQARVPRHKEDVQVTPGARPGVQRSAGDHRLTFNAPFALPDVSLPAGTYVFRAGPANTLQVLSADGSTAYAWLLAIPASRQATTRLYEVRFGEPLAEGGPRRVTAVFEPRREWGYELIYVPRSAQADESRRLANATR